MNSFLVGSRSGANPSGIFWRKSWQTIGWNGFPLGQTHLFQGLGWVGKCPFLGILKITKTNMGCRWNLSNSGVMWNIGTFANPCLWLPFGRRPGDNFRWWSNMCRCRRWSRSRWLCYFMQVSSLFIYLCVYLYLYQIYVYVYIHTCMYVCNVM